LRFGADGAVADSKATTILGYSHALPTDMRAASKAWHNALADVITEDRKHKSQQSLGNSRKIAFK
jgi:hypothetical protein